MQTKNVPKLKKMDSPESRSTMFGTKEVVQPHQCKLAIVLHVPETMTLGWAVLSSLKRAAPPS